MRILIVDDDYISGVKLKAILVQYGDCDLAPSGQVALSLIEAAAEQGKSYDLMTLDLHMPDISGQDVLNQLRSREVVRIRQGKQSNPTRVMVVTGSTDDNEMRRILSTGADTYLRKPFNASSIEKTLEKLFIKPNQESVAIGGSKRILIVDDCYTSGVMLKDCMNKYGDCDLAPNGSIALELYSESRRQSVPYEFIALDANLPDMNGTKILKLIRNVEKLDKARGNSTKAYIMMLSATKEKQTIMEAIENGVNGYLLKPFQNENIHSELLKAGIVKST